MYKVIKIILRCISIYRDYLLQALIEIYFYYKSPYPLLVLLKKISLANRKIRITIFPKSKGRNPIEQAIIDLIIELKKLNPFWGAQRISDELKKIGYIVSKPTVLKYLEIYSLGPPPGKGLTWTEFISNHKFKVGIDFTSVISFLGHQLFIFVIINLDTRELMHINITLNPCRDWILQQFRNAFFDLSDYPSLCICDRDTIFSGWFKDTMKSYFGMKVKPIPIKSPTKNGITERFHLSLKREGLKNIAFLSLEQSRQACINYQKYYNEYRPHQGIKSNIPNSKNSFPKTKSDFYKKEHLNGRFTTLEPAF